MSSRYTIVIKNGTIIDGTGKKKYSAGLAVTGDTIAGIGRYDPDQADLHIDARNLALTPGFVDLHSHGDLLPFLDEPFLSSRIVQGITTDVTGQCGIGPVPAGRDMKEYRDYCAPIIGTTGEMERWTGFASYAKGLQNRGPVHNHAFFIPHGPVRAGAAGMGAAPVTKEQLSRMTNMVRRGMEAGAFGISFGLSYIPGMYADRREITALCRTAAGYGGIMMVHVRSHSLKMPEAVEECMSIARETGIRLHISHLRSYGNRDYGVPAKILLGLVDKGIQSGIPITFDEHPYRSGSTVLTQILPPFFKEKGKPAMMEMLRRPETPGLLRDIIAPPERKVIDSSGSWDDYAGLTGWDRILISSVGKEKNRGYIGKTIGEIGRETGDGPEKTALRIILEDDGKTCMVMKDIFSEKDIELLYSHPKCFVGSDGIPTGRPHPRLFGAFPKFLNLYAGPGKPHTLESAVSRITGEAAGLLEIPDRGVLKPGMKADIVILDPLRIRDREDYIDPARPPEGIHTVLVNGRPVYTGCGFSSIVSPEPKQVIRAGAVLNSGGRYTTI